MVPSGFSVVHCELSAVPSGFSVEHCGLSAVPSGFSVALGGLSATHSGFTLVSMGFSQYSTCCVCGWGGGGLRSILIESVYYR